MPRFILRNPDGTVQLDLSKSITKFLGSVVATQGNGSIVVPGFADGRAFYFVFLSADSAGRSVPAVSISGTTLSWSANFSSAGVRIGYGIY